MARALSPAVAAQVMAEDADQACTIWFIAQRMGRAGWGAQRLARYVQQLVDQRGFPPPWPEMVRGRLVDAVRPASKWDRAAVLQWLHDFLPPDAAASANAAARAIAARTMDQAAFGLKLVKGGRP